MKMTTVKSSNIAAIGYNSLALELHVEFKSGKTFAYKYVTPNEYIDFLESDSVGKHFAQFIKPGRDAVEVVKEAVEVVEVVEVGSEFNEKLDCLQKALYEWASNQFKDQPVSGKFAHLRKEVNELESDQKDVMEYADCYMLLMDIASNNGVLLSDIHAAAERKLEINKKRKWGKQSEDGSVEHVREDA
jgi:hypothetical protein